MIPKHGNVSTVGNGKVSVPVSDIVNSPKVQRQVTAARELEKAMTPNEGATPESVLTRLQAIAVEPNITVESMRDALDKAAAWFREHNADLERRLAEAVVKRDDYKAAAILHADASLRMSAQLAERREWVPVPRALLEKWANVDAFNAPVGAAMEIKVWAQQMLSAPQEDRKDG